jgi:hypothetical protein
VVGDLSNEVFASDLIHTPSPARGRSSKAAQALSAVEGTTIALWVLHCADCQAESALEQLRGAPSPHERDTPTDRERQAETPTGSASCNGAGAAPPGLGSLSCCSHTLSSSAGGVALTAAGSSLH